MNAERLHAIVKVLEREMEDKSLPSSMEELIRGLRSVVQQSNATTQQNLSTYIKSMYEALSNSEVDRFSPAWRQILREIGGEEFFGAVLKKQVEEIIAKNQLTPAVAADELDQISARMVAFEKALGQTTAAFKTFNIGDEQLTPGQCEIGMLIPRDAVDNRLVDFSNELKELSFILNTFSEVATGEPDDLAIRTISSSDLLVYLNAHVTFAACVAVAIERIVALYKNLLEIRKLQVEIQRQGVPEDLTTGIEEHANSLMERGIEKVSVEIVNQFYKGKDGGRTNELTNAVRISLNKIANRIDKGYNLEVRCSPVVADDDSNDAEAQESAIATIQAASANMQFLKLEGNPLLRLPEKREGSGQPAENERLREGVRKSRTSKKRVAQPGAEGKA